MSNLKQAKDGFKDFLKGKDILTDQEVGLKDPIEINGKTSIILELN